MLLFPPTDELRRSEDILRNLPKNMTYSQLIEKLAFLAKELTDILMPSEKFKEYLIQEYGDNWVTYQKQRIKEINNEINLVNASLTNSQID